MKNSCKEAIKTLFKNLCCSKCKNDFDSESITIKSEENNVMICHLKCQICSMDFGDIVLNINKKSDIHNPMEIIEGPPAININDVIEAHRFIKKMK